MTKSHPLPKDHSHDKSHESNRSMFSLNRDHQATRNGPVTTAFHNIGNLSVSLGAPHAVRNPITASTSDASWTPYPTRSPTESPSVDTSSPRSKFSKDHNTAFLASDIFPENVSKFTQEISLPKVGNRIETTAQLVVCAELLACTTGGTSDSFRTYGDINWDALNPSQAKWLQEMNERPLEKDYIQQLMNQMVDIFFVLPNKTSDVICEIILLGPVLDKEHYRTLLNWFLNDLKSEVVLNISVLQGLVRLVERAPPFYLRSDDLTKILRTIRDHLKDPAQQDTEYTIRLTVAICRVLVIMVDCGVKDLNREQEHEPLLEILSKLRMHKDSLVRYQVEYACRALQLVPDDETIRQGFTRNAIGLAGGLMKVSSAIQLDFGGVSEGLPAVIRSGRGLVDTMKKYFGSSHKNPWFMAVREAAVMVSEDRLTDFGHLICEVDCHQDPFFQWGVCQILGDMAIDPLWDVTTRKRAVNSLGGIFQSSPRSDQYQDVHTWILTLLRNISELQWTDLTTDIGNSTIKRHALMMVRWIEDTGTEMALSLQHAHLAINYPGPPTPSLLLEMVRNTPSLELVVDRLRHQRRAAYSLNAVYIPPLSKSGLQASDDNPDPLNVRVYRFLRSKEQVILILGDSGAGKSSFSARLEHDMWKAYRAGGPIPLFIDLKSIRHLDQDLIMQHLDGLHIFSSTHMDDLRSRQFILICDGYDETRCRSNLYTNNQFNQPNQWKAKMIISCRTQYLTPGYRTYFAPQQEAANEPGSPSTELFTEAVIVPFKADQIKDYIRQYTTVARGPGELEDRSPTWTAEQYMDRLGRIAHIMELIKNPFMLRMILEILPKIALTTTEITRVELYDEFVDSHYANEQIRLIKQRSSGKMDPDRLAVFDEVEGPDLTDLGISFSKRLAAAIFNEQGGVNSVEYSSANDKGSWKGEFFAYDTMTRLLLESSQVVSRTSASNPQELIRGRTRSNGGRNTFRFSHSSILEYYYALSIYDPREDLPQLDSTTPLTLASSPSFTADHPLGQRNLVSEPATLHFLAERVQYIPKFRDHLHALIQLSKTDVALDCAAANAITILIRAGERFNGADLRGIRVPGADLSRGDFDSALLQGADLRNTILRNVWLHRANLDHSRMDGVVFGQWPYLEMEDGVWYCAFSPDGTLLTVGLGNGAVAVFDTTTWSRFISHGKQDSLHGPVAVSLWDTKSEEPRSALSDQADPVTSLAYSPCTQHIISGCQDRTVRLWDIRTGALRSTLLGHTQGVSSVAYSPSGQNIASGSTDRTVRIWDVQTGALRSLLSAHTGAVHSVVFSPSGDQLASGGRDYTVRLWDAETGRLQSTLAATTGRVYSVAYSPNGQQLVTGNNDSSIRLWDVQTGALTSTLNGHTDGVSSVMFSPNGRQIASGSFDKTVRIWDAQTGELRSTLSGHKDSISTVAYSPDGQQIASGGYDQTVRLWDAQTGELGSPMNGHSETVSSVAYSPSGQQIVSTGYDRTVRLWDSQTGALFTVLRGHSGAVAHAAFSPHGQQIASGSWDNSVRLWDAQAGALSAVLTGHTDYVTSVAYSPHGRHLASSSYDETVRLWDAWTGDLNFVLSGHTGIVACVVYSPGGRQVASGGSDRTVRIWDANTGAFIASLSGHTDGVSSVAYSSNGWQIASGSFDKTVVLWDAQTGAHCSTLSGHTGPVTSVGYSPDGEKIATGSEDKTVRLWDQATGQCLVTLDGFQDGIHSIAWGAAFDGGACLVVGGRDRSVRTWEVRKNADDGGTQVYLHWRSTPDTLVLSKVSIQGVRGLSEMNKRLLLQHLAEGQPASS